MVRRKRYPVEFKAEAVKLAKAGGKTFAALAADIGIPQTTLVGWVRAADKRAEPGALNEDERVELRRLRREIETLQLERDFLKKAAAFFAKESK
jgi:transposase